MKKSSLAAPILIVILLAGCTSGNSDTEPPGASPTSPSVSASPRGDEGGTQSGGSNTSPDPSPSVTADQATVDYVECLNDHGLNAVIGSDGTVQYAVTEEDLGENGQPIAPGDSVEQAEAAALCQDAVPGYSPPDYNER